ncbi:ATP-binding protein [Candidatus Woesearchaeota archaeon]|nr:ATP-binding protein [Candidatus Woesearchaeota archaeon]
MTKIISAWPGTGKTYLGRNSDSTIIDFRSGLYSKDDEKIINPNFPENYIGAMKKIIPNYEIILISCHSVVIDALEKEKISYTLIYPEIFLKEEYIKRYKNRANPEGWIQNVANNWEKWIKDFDKLKCNKIKLQKGQYLSDIIC